MQNTAKRIEYLDFVRIFAMLSVILLHCICDYNSDGAAFGRPLWYLTCVLNEITRVGVPLFFMTSGALMLEGRTSDLGRFYKSRFSKILPKFAVYTLLYYVFFSVLNGEKIFDFRFVSQVLNSGTAYHLWYMYSLCAIYLLMPFFGAAAEKFGRGGIFILLCLIVFQTGLKPVINIFARGKIYIYLCEDGVLGYTGYVLLGYILSKTEFTRFKRYALYLAAVVCTAVFAAANAGFALTGEGFPFNFGYGINHYIEAAAVFVLLKYAPLPGGKLAGLLSKTVFDVYFIHVLLIELFKLWFLNRVNLAPSACMLLMLVFTVVFGFGFGIVVLKIKEFINEKNV